MNSRQILEALNEALQLEVQAAVRNLHYSFQVVGLSRKPVAEFFREEAEESLKHATLLGEKIIALGGQPSFGVQAFHKSKPMETEEILRDSLKHDEAAVKAYTKLLKLVESDTPLRVLFENQVLAEQEHVEEIRKMLRTRAD